MLIVGSSIAIVGKASGFSKSAIVSPISKFSRPTAAHISPALIISTFFLPKPSKVFISLILDFKISPFLLTRLTCWFEDSFPL